MSYYFIGNGSATIGGGSMGRTEQVPSLKLLCLDLCSRHLDQMNNLGDMPTEMFIDLLNRAKAKATPEVVQRLQDINERLLCEDVDVAFWKRAVDEHILRRMIPAPGPVLVERVNDCKERLVELIAEMPDTPSKEWSLEVNEILKELGEIPASVGLLRETMIGKAVGPLRKSSDTRIASLSADIIRRWKEAARTNGPEQQKCSAASSSAPSKAGGSVGVSEDKQRAVEEGFNCRTWNSLYKFLELLREDKVRVSSKRAREARERELQKKPRMIVGKSKGEGFLIQRSGRGSGKAPPIEIPISHASSMMKTPTSKGGRSNSGIKTSGIKTSGIKTGGIRTSGIMTSSKNKRNISNISSSKTKSGSSSSSSSSRSRSSSSSSASSSSSKSKSKGGVATLAEIRRKIAIDQRHSTAFKGDRPGPSNEERPPGKRSKFWQ